MSRHHPYILTRVIKYKENPVNAAPLKACREGHNWPTEIWILLAGRGKQKSGNMNTCYSYMNNGYAIFHFRIWGADNYHQVLELVTLPVILVCNLHLQAPKFQTKKLHMSFFSPKISNIIMVTKCLPHLQVSQLCSREALLNKNRRSPPPVPERERNVFYYHYINYYILIII